MPPEGSKGDPKYHEIKHTNFSVLCFFSVRVFSGSWARLSLSSQPTVHSPSSWLSFPVLSPILSDGTPMRSSIDRYRFVIGVPAA